MQVTDLPNKQQNKRELHTKYHGNVVYICTTHEALIRFVYVNYIRAMVAVYLHTYYILCRRVR